MGEAAEFWVAWKGALSGVHTAIKILKLSMEAAQEVILSLEADLTSTHKPPKWTEIEDRKALWGS